MNKCLECGKALNGRAGQKFCSDSCRNTYNNRLNTDATNYIRNINNALRRNRRILHEIYRDNSKVKKEFLVDRGFNFNLLTSSGGQKGKAVRWVYDYGYYESKETITIVKRDKLK
jgi:hypothetical protein